MKKMISIILIGKNEGRNLSKSLESVYNLISIYPKYDFEVIYIDSKSTDDSLERAISFKNIKIFEIIGEANPAVARNIGVKEAKGDILFFIDADMEIQPEFLGYALNRKGELKYDYLTGHLDDYFYTVDHQFIKCEPRTYNKNLPKVNQELNQNGGLCITKKKIWNSVGGMRNKYRRSQDLDLTIRLKKNGIKIIRMPFLAAKHHTIDYRNEKRMWKSLWNGNNFYPGMIFRDHVYNIDVIKRVLRSDYTAILIFVFLLSLFFIKALMPFMGGFYLITLTFRIFFQSRKAKTKKKQINLFFREISFPILFRHIFLDGFFVLLSFKYFLEVY